MKKPNILWIMTDQQSAGMMSCAGNAWVSTPNMDAIARAGTHFTRTYCVNPVCLPSRFGLLTGLYPRDAAVCSNAFYRESPGLPAQVTANGLGTLLKRQGYDAVYGGKEHLPFVGAADLGFEKLCSDDRDGLAEQFAAYIRSHRQDRPFAMIASFAEPHDICYMAIADAAEEGYTGDFPSNFMEYSRGEMKDYLAAARLPEGVCREEFFETLCPPLPENHRPAPDEPEAISLLQAQRDFKKYARENYTPEQWRLHRWAYKRLTEKADAQIGRLLEALRESGQWEDTVIIFTSDHGDMDAAHKMEHKECMYEECCRVPLLIKGIGAPAGQKDDRLVCNALDVFPTVLAYAGAPLPDYLEGCSLMEIVQGKTDVCRRSCLVLECENGLMAVDETGKYVRYDRGDRAQQFYHLGENPGEMYDQSGDVRFAAQIAALRAAVDVHSVARPQRFGIRPLQPAGLRYTTRMKMADFWADDAVQSRLRQHGDAALYETLRIYEKTDLPVTWCYGALRAEQKAFVEGMLEELHSAAGCV